MAIKEINRFIQEPEGGGCPRFQTRQYMHEEYGLVEVTVDECDYDNENMIEDAIAARLDETLEMIREMKENESTESIIIECENGEDLII